MRAVVLLVFLSGCGLALDFDPVDPPDAGGPGFDGGDHRRDLGTEIDAGADDLGRPRLDGGARDLGNDDLGGLVDLGPPDDGVIGVEAGVGDAGPGGCLSNAECRVASGEFCEQPDTMCGAVGFCTTRPGACTLVIDPVCSCDGVDFGNACLAHAAGANVAFRGTCTVSTACDFVSTLIRGCSTDSNCAVGIHQSDCCGNTVAIGMNHSELTRFASLEPICDASYPSCGCPVGPTMTDSGETTFDPSMVMVACVVRGPDTVCLTYVTTRPPDGP